MINSMLLPLGTAIFIGFCTRRHAVGLFWPGNAIVHVDIMPFFIAMGRRTIGTEASITVSTRDAGRTEAGRSNATVRGKKWRKLKTPQLWRLPPLR
jgi:hypothetical protein